MSSLPAHFTPAPTPIEGGAEDRRLVQVLDLLSVGDQLVSPSVLAVGVDASGRHVVAAPRESERFFAPAHQQLVLHQLAQPAGPRHLSVDALWLFDLQLVEQLSDESTWNDPVFLYGTLSGPVRGPGRASLEAVRGQLACTRADLLEAFVRGMDTPFGPPARADGGVAERSVSLLLPGEPDDGLGRGEGFILASPVPPAELADSGGNGALVRLVVQQVLTQLQVELDGRKRSLLSKLFVAPPRVAPSNHASTTELVALARTALGLMQGWPAARVSLLFSRVGASRSGAAPTVAARSLPAPPPRTSQPRNDDWMKDFLDAHVREGRAPARVSTPTPAAGTTAWMDDFAKPPRAPSTAPPAGTPDWMKDFE